MIFEFKNDLPQGRGRRTDRTEMKIPKDYFEKKSTQSSFSIIPYFLPNPGRILPVLMEKSKIKIVFSWD